MTPSPVLVLGVGNLLLADEGVGIHALRRLEERAWPDHIDLLDGGTGGFQLLALFQQYPRMVILDAALDGRPVGTVSVLKPRFASDFPRVLSAHDIGLRDLLETATLLGPLPRMTLITVSVAPDQPMSTELSDPVAAALPEVVAAVERLVAPSGAPA